MLFGRHRTDMPDESQALAGRPGQVSVPERHFVNGNPLEPPFPEDLEQAIRRAVTSGV